MRINCLYYNVISLCCFVPYNRFYSKVILQIVDGRSNVTNTGFIDASKKFTLSYTMCGSIIVNLSLIWEQQKLSYSSNFTINYHSADSRYDRSYSVDIPSDSSSLPCNNENQTLLTLRTFHNLDVRYSSKCCPKLTILFYDTVRL